MCLLNDSEVYAISSLLESLFKMNLMKERGCDPNFCYGTAICDIQGKYVYMFTFDFINHNKQDWGLTDTKSIKSTIFSL